MPSLLVLDELAVPSIYWQPVRPQAQASGATQRTQTGQRNHRRYPLQSRAGVEREDTVMGFSAKQLKTLQRNLNSRYVRTRRPMDVSSPISRAGTRSRKPTEFSALMPGAGRPLNPAVCSAEKTVAHSSRSISAKVRITVEADGMKIIREGHGSGEGRATSSGEVHDIALKAAETDATKRALATFGNHLGSSSIGRTRRASSNTHPHCSQPL